MGSSVVHDIYLEAGEEAVLLLHSFTSNANEMRKLAVALHEEGYTCYAPNLAGHGFGPEHLFATTMEEVYEGAKKAIEMLLQRGFKHIFLVGQSLGGVLSIRLAGQYKECKAVCIISSPVIERPIQELELRVERFSRRFLTIAGEAEAVKEAFLAKHFPRPVEKIRALQQFIIGSGRQVGTIHQPVFLAKGMLDDTAFHESIDLIEQAVASDIIVKKEYAASGHLVTLGKDREQLQQDIIVFLGAKQVRSGNLSRNGGYL